MMSAREVLMMAIGILIGVALQKPDVCQRLCCAARDKWKNGEDPGLPPQKPHTMMSDDHTEKVIHHFSCKNGRHFFRNGEVGEACKCRHMELVLENGVRVVRPAMNTR